MDDRPQAPPHCIVCGERCTAARWHRTLGWVYHDECTACGGPVCDDPRCFGDADGAPDGPPFFHCARCTAALAD